MPPYWWDDSQRCLSRRHAVRHSRSGLRPGRRPATTHRHRRQPPSGERARSGRSWSQAGSRRRSPIRSARSPSPGSRSRHRPPQDHDLTRTAVAGNLVPAAQGLRTTETFAIPPGPGGPAGPALALVRVGANWTPQDPPPDYRYCLASGPLAWIATAQDDADTPVAASPEIVLARGPGRSRTCAVGVGALAARRRGRRPGLHADARAVLAGAHQPTARPGSTTTATAARRSASATVPSAVPAGPGTTFQRTYRVGGGSAATSRRTRSPTVVRRARRLARSVPAPTRSRPPAARTPRRSRRSATGRPRQFSAEPLRVVRARTMSSAAQSLPWVQQAGTTFRWTGSWLTVLTAANPAGAEQPTIAEVESTSPNCSTGAARRLRELRPAAALRVDRPADHGLCASPRTSPAMCRPPCSPRCSPVPSPAASTGFFDHSRWSFGAAAGVQRAAGRHPVLHRRRRRRPGPVPRARGSRRTGRRCPRPLTVAADQILRVDNDPSRPEAGSLSVTVNGGKA